MKLLSNKKSFLFALTMLISVNALAENTESIDYNNPDTWLCRPEAPGACAVNLDTTVISADGSLKIEPFIKHPKPEIDCFYIYPTVSSDPGGNSDMSAGPEERRVIDAQFARFASVCRTFAPLYRQITLTALRAGFSEKPLKIDGRMAYADVVAAWKHYLKNDNNGRGVVLIGHSQGAGMLAQLLRNEIEGQPAQDLIVSAILAGTSNIVEARDGAEGTFRHFKLCVNSDDTNCIVTFASFRREIPPPENSIFGRARDGSGTSACNNPANLEGGEQKLTAYFSSQGFDIVLGQSDVRWVSGNVNITTPYVSVPGLLSGQCVQDNGYSYFAVSTHADPDDPRADKVPGDIIVDGTVLEAWGLHLIDMHLVMGDLIDLVQSQGESYKRKSM